MLPDMKTTLKALHEMGLFFITGHGESDVPFKGLLERSLQILLQGNGDCPSLWITISVILAQEIYNKGHRTVITDEIYVVINTL